MALRLSVARDVNLMLAIKLVSGMRRLNTWGTLFL